jgi:hypothetical protein
MSKSDFRTELIIPVSDQKINFKASIITLGSCFSDVIGNYLSENKFSTLVNPFGTVYNPISIFNLIVERTWDENKFVKSNGSIFHHDAHSSFFDDSEKELKTRLVEVKSLAIEKIRTANWLIITFGTSIVYKLRDTDQVVSNCHKVPQINFTKHSLSMSEMIKGFKIFYDHIKLLNPSINLLLAVSPVRHIKDGLLENALSKSKLRMLCDEFQKQLTDVHYFPSYEIMMDDLRDYRFYKGDMIHPNEVAEHYIWELFQEVYFDSKTQQFIKEWKKIKDALAHKPFNPKSKNHKNFLYQTLLQLRLFTELVDVTHEEKILKEQLP